MRVITFDLDDTLWDASDVLHRADRALQAWLADRHPRIPERYGPRDLRALMAEIARRDPGIAHDFTRLRIAALEHAARETGYPAGVGERAFEVFLEARNDVRLFADVLPALQRLRPRYRLASLTNGNADVARVGLDGYFRVALSAIDVGAAKPDPAMFHAACEALGARPPEAVHVGDDADSDIGGAAAAGMRTVWVNRDGRPWPGGPRPDAEVASLAELHHVLRELAAVDA